MEDICSTPNLSIKTVEINDGGNNYKCQIQTIKDFIQVSLFIEANLKQEGIIHITNIQSQIVAFINYEISEIFEEINLLNKECFSLIKEGNKYSLKIEFKVFRKKQYLKIDLIPKDNNNINQEDLYKTIAELKEIIKSKDEKIKKLEEELSQYRTISNKSDNSYNNYDIKLKEPMHIIKYHSSCVYCSILLKDGRFATCSCDNSIIIYNNKTFKPDLTIKEHSGYVNCITQLSSGILASASSDKTIKLFNINGNSYNVLQTLTYHTNYVYKIIELKNKNLVSCSEDKSIIFYIKDNNQYLKDFSITTNGKCSPVIQTKDNEICYSEETNNAICFFDLNQRKSISKINNINKRIGSYDWYLMMNKDLLLITGENILSIINVNSKSLVRTINVPGSSWINIGILLNENTILTADNNFNIIQWKIDGDNLTLVSKKEKANNKPIGALLKIGNGLIISGDDDGTIKVWTNK